MNSFNEFVSRDNRGTTQGRRRGQPRDNSGTSTGTTAAGTELTADGTTRDNRRGHGTDGGRDNSGQPLARKRRALFFVFFVSGTTAGQLAGQSPQDRDAHVIITCLADP